MDSEVLQTSRISWTGDAHPPAAPMPPRQHALATNASISPTEQRDRPIQDDDRDGFEVFPEAMEPSSHIEPRPASATVIAAVEKKPYAWFIKAKEAVLDGTCTVCMEKFADGDSVAALSCAHFFHQTCVESWLSRFDECPLCRSRLSSA